MDGVTLFAAGLIAGGVTILVFTVVAAARRIGILPGRQGVAAGRGRGYARVSRSARSERQRAPQSRAQTSAPRDARLRPDLDGARPRAVFREDPMARRGAPWQGGPDPLDPRLRDDVSHASGTDPRRALRRDDAGFDRARRPDGNRGQQGMPPVRRSALVGDTVQLQSVPAWSIPARPLNEGPRLRPPGPYESSNDAPRYIDPSSPPQPGANASRRHEGSDPEGRVYGGR